MLKLRQSNQNVLDQVLQIIAERGWIQVREIKILKGRSLYGLDPEQSFSGYNLNSPAYYEETEYRTLDGANIKNICRKLEELGHEVQTYRGCKFYLKPGHVLRFELCPKYPGKRLVYMGKINLRGELYTLKSTGVSYPVPINDLGMPHPDVVTEMKRRSEIFVPSWEIR